MIRELQDELLDTMVKRSIEPLAKKVEDYFKKSGYLDELNTEISAIYMQRWAQYIANYMTKKHIPLVRIDIEKVAMKVAKYLMKHCRVAKKCDGKGYCDTCDYIKEAELEQCVCLDGYGHN